MPDEAAFWIRPVDDGHWTLCIVSKEIDEKTYDLGYGEVLRLVQEMKTPYIDPFQVRLLRGDDPLALAALEIHRRYPGNMATRLGGREFGAIAVEGGVHLSRFARRIGEYERKSACLGVKRAIDAAEKTGAGRPFPFVSAGVDGLHFVCDSGGVLRQEVSPVVTDIDVGRGRKGPPTVPGTFSRNQP